MWKLLESMSETKETGSKSEQSGRGTLKLKRTVDAGHVRQNVSGGRSKSVVVEKKRKRTLNKPGASTANTGAEGRSKAPARNKKMPGGLSNAEHEARMKALAEAKGRREDEERVALEDAKRREAESIEARATLDERRREEEEAEKRKAEAAAAPKAAAKSPAGKAPAAKGKVEPTVDPQDLEAAAAKAEVAGAKRAPKPREAADKLESENAKKKNAKVDRSSRRGEARVKGRLTITNALNENQRERSLASLKRKREREKSKSAPQTPREKIVREVTIPETVTIQELANRMTVRGVDVIKYMMQQGQMHKINDLIDADTAELIVEEFGHIPRRVSEADVEEGLFDGDEDEESTLLPRAPVVTVMGHVDHGKTSLLDALRKENVVAGEAGGITQHIGAYQVETSDQHKVTFIDTPGHEAFTAMRARGAKVTDIVVLVVAADDGVMPQTVEAINHAQAAEVPIIVAINKIDKPDSDPQRVRTDLLQHSVVVESMSGDTLEVEVSALKKQGLDDLLEAIHNQAELLELKANPDRRADGIVVEAQLERGRGPVGTMLVQRGTIKVGQIIVAGRAWGKVRALINDHGDNVVEAGPSVPVEVLGFNTAPEAGDQFAIVENEARAREITEYRIKKRRDIRAAGAGSVRTLEQMMNQLHEADMKEIPVVIKGDVQGSVEAIIAALDKLGNEEVVARVIHSGVGGITESDIALANASEAIIFGFNVRANSQARAAAQSAGIEIRYYSVIYDLVDEVKAAMSGLLDPTIKEHFIGNAEILEVFHISKVGKVAGCRVTEGKMERGAGVRLIRDDVVIHEGKLSTLKRFKDEVPEVPAGQECGTAFENYQDIKSGDIIEAFRIEEIERTL
ncbi:MAG: translation initiation factor IF-2 [Rhodomicrobium sp.]|nr:MAG: translation initiation factor IF-2 [Rhodomicrobium sp.]